MLVLKFMLVLPLNMCPKKVIRLNACPEVHVLNLCPEVSVLLKPVLNINSVTCVTILQRMRQGILAVFKVSSGKKAALGHLSPSDKDTIKS